jgi:hypothetical protein
MGLFRTKPKLGETSILSDYEFAIAKQKLLDERWES